MPRSSGSVRAEASETSSAMGGKGKRERKSALAFFLSSSIGEAKVIGRKKFHPALNARFGLSDLTNLLEALMVGENEEVHTE